MTNYLLDTHVLHWWITGVRERVDDELDDILSSACVQSRLFISAITFWEIALLQKKGRLEADTDPLSWRAAVLNLGMQEVPVSADVAVRSIMLENMHNDPADRMLAATAVTHHLTLVTADRMLLEWPGGLMTMDAR